jgi:hypothetical protein
MTATKGGSVMCYSSHKDFGWNVEKKPVREPERQPEPTAEDQQEVRTPVEDSKLRDFINRRRVHRETAPVADRTHEKV